MTKHSTTHGVSLSYINRVVKLANKAAAPFELSRGDVIKRGLQLVEKECLAKIAAQKKQPELELVEGAKGDAETI